MFYHTKMRTFAVHPANRGLTAHLANRGLTVHPAKEDLLCILQMGVSAANSCKWELLPRIPQMRASTVHPANAMHASMHAPSPDDDSLREMMTNSGNSCYASCRKYLGALRPISVHFGTPRRTPAHLSALRNTSAHSGSSQCTSEHLGHSSASQYNSAHLSAIRPFAAHDDLP